MDRPEARAAWNLYWLSDPAVDSFLADAAGWDAAPAIDLEMLQACFEAVGQKSGPDFLKDLLLSMAPLEFVARIALFDHTHLAPFRLRGGAWIDTINARRKLYRGVDRDTGKVAFASFGQRSSDLKIATKAMESAKLMTLALRKT